MASAFIGQIVPGYSDRNRDYGFMVHGALGCDGEFQYMVTVTNGDGPVHRNVLDGSTDDPLAFGARVNWDIMGHMGYEEGALRQRSCEWVAAVGAWAHYFVDHRLENPLDGDQTIDRLTYGADAAVGWGGFSLTAAYNGVTLETGSDSVDAFSYLIQVGYLFPDTAWEIAARYSAYEVDSTATAVSGNEMAVAVNYYIDGHSDKVTLDAAFISTDDDNILSDTYAGYNATGDGRRDHAAPAVAARAVSAFASTLDARRPDARRPSRPPHLAWLVRARVAREGAHPRPPGPELAVHPLRGWSRGRWGLPAKGAAAVAAPRFSTCIASRAPAAPRRTSSGGDGSRLARWARGRASARSP